MSFKQSIKKGRRLLARKGMLFCYRLIWVLPFPLIEGFLHFLFSVAFALTYHLRNMAKKSLRMAFGPDLSEERIQEIVNACFRNIRYGIIELLYYSRYPEQVNESFEYEGQDHLDAALAKGKGAVMVTAHFGNFALMMLSMARKGYKVQCILRLARDKRMAEEAKKIMDRVGVRTIYSKPPQKCVMDSIRALRNNELVFVLLDQHYGSAGGVMVEFFGRQAATATGPVVLSKRTGAPIIPVFCLRQGKNRHRIIINPEFPLAECPTEEETIRTNIGGITRLIEQYIRKYPEEWGWMHRRWKKEG